MPCEPSAVAEGFFVFATKGKFQRSFEMTQIHRRRPKTVTVPSRPVMFGTPLARLLRLIAERMIGNSSEVMSKPTKGSVHQRQRDDTMK